MAFRKDRGYFFGVQCSGPRDSPGIGTQESFVNPFPFGAIANKNGFGVRGFGRCTNESLDGFPDPLLLLREPPHPGNAEGFEGAFGSRGRDRCT